MADNQTIDNKVDKLKVEFACTGNGGRSPIAETEARDYISELGLDDRIEVYSSGTDADTLKNNILSLGKEELLPYIESAYQKGTFRGKMKDKAEEIISGNANDDLYQAVMDYLTVDEETKRNTVLLEEGLTPKGPFHVQTTDRSDTDIVLAMKKSNAEKASKIYKTNKPEIYVITDFAEYNGKMNDPYGGTLQDYRNTRDALKEVVRKSIDKIAEQYL